LICAFEPYCCDHNWGPSCVTHLAYCGISDKEVCDSIPDSFLVAQKDCSVCQDGAAIPVTVTKSKKEKKEKVEKEKKEKVEKETKEKVEKETKEKVEKEKGKNKDEFDDLDK